MLKAYTIEGPATFSMQPVVWVTIQETKDTLGLVARFLQWDNQIYPVIPAGHSGGGSMAHAYSPEDAEKIRAWLVEQGVKEET